MTQPHPTVDPRPVAIPGTGPFSLSTPWAVAAGALLALLLVGSYPVQFFLNGIWDVLLGPWMRRGASATSVSAVSVAFWGSTVWTVSALGIATVAMRSVAPARLATVVGVTAGAVVSSALVALVWLGHWPGVSLPLAGLLGAVTGRVLHAHVASLQARRKADARLQMQEAVRQAKAEFLGQLSRDLRTPVHAVLGVADLLNETGLDAEQRRHLDVFRRSADALTHLLEEVDDLSRIESGRVRLKPTTVALVPLIHDEIARAKQHADSKGVQIQLTLSADLPRQVSADPDRLSQVLSELLSHAIRVTRQGRVQVEVRPHSRDPHRVRFAFCDRSLSPETGKVASLVEPFTATGHTRRAPSGIGMTLARRVVTLMGGRVSVRQSPGKGSTVVLSLPLPAVHSETDGLPELAAAPQPAAAVEPAHGPRISVLLVDDNVSTRQLIESMLDPRQFTVVTCTNGREALQTLEIAPYDVVLMDLHMPEMDGWAALRALRQRESERASRRTPVIALGSAPFEVERQRCLDAGFDQHLCKPLRKSRLVEGLVRLAQQPPESAPPAATAARTGALRYDQRDSLNLLSSEGLIDVRSAVESLGGDATLYLDAIEHLAPALHNWPQRFRETLARNEHERARQMAVDMQGILEVVGAGACANALGRMATLLSSTTETHDVQRGLADLDQHLQPIMQTLKVAVDRIRLARQDRSRREQGHNSAF